MEVSPTNPELQAKLDQLVSTTGRPANELVEDAMSGYFDESTQISSHRHLHLFRSLTPHVSGSIRFNPVKIQFDNPV